MRHKITLLICLFYILLSDVSSIVAQGEFSRDTIEISNDKLSVKIDTKGAEIISIFNKECKIEHIWQGDKDSWSKHSPILFPFVGKIKGGRYKYKGKSYKMKNHGFANHRLFKIINKSDTGVVLLLQSDRKTLKIYPFRFKLIVKYTLDGNKLLITDTVENIDTQKMYFSIGGHPGFNIPFEGNKKFNDYIIEFENNEFANRIVLSKPKGLPTDEYRYNYLKGKDYIELNHALFEDRVVILEGIKSNFLTIKQKDGLTSIRIGGINKFPYLGIWTSVKKKAPFVCIEPWFGISDYENFKGEIEEKKGIQMLNPGKNFKMDYYIQILNK